MYCIAPISSTKGAAPEFMLNRSNGKSYYAFVNDDNGIITSIIFDEEDPKEPDFITSLSDEEFLVSLSKILDERFKGVIINLFDHKPKKYSNNYEFCCAIREQLNALKIPYHFTAPTEMMTTLALINGKITSKIGDTVLRVLIGRQNYIITEYEFTENGYKRINGRAVPYISEPNAITKAKIMASSNPTVILGYTPFNDVSTKKLAAIMKGEKKFVLADTRKYAYKYAGEMIKWMLDKSYVKFYVQPYAWKNTGVIGVMGQACKDLFEIHCDTHLPAEESYIVSKNFSHFVVLSINEKNKGQQDPVARKELPKNCHRAEISVAIDINQFVYVKAKEIIIPEIEALPKQLDKICESKIPVIGFYGYSSVICVSKDGGDYKFLEQWGGLYGNELFINFDTQPVKFGADAISPFKTSMNSVIFDLIKIMSMPVNNIKKDPKWNFKITKDSAHPCLLEFTKHDGTLGAAAPSFLMAMLLKEQIAKIKEELGEKPKEIGFCFFDTFNAVERRRLEGKLKEACELLKISCFFVDI